MTPRPLTERQRAALYLMLRALFVATLWRASGYLDPALGGRDRALFLFAGWGIADAIRWVVFGGRLWLPER